MISMPKYAAFSSIQAMVCRKIGSLVVNQLAVFVLNIVKIN